MYNNKYIIVFEGIDGAGKSTQCLKLCDMLSKNGYSCKYVNVQKSYIIRRIFDEVNNKCKDYNYINRYEWTIMVYEKCKAYYECLVSNADFQIVIFDRYIYTERIGLKRFYTDKRLYDVLVNWLPSPDIVFYMEIDCEEAFARTVLRNRSSKKTLHELKKFANDYQLEFANNEGELIRINSSGSIESVYKRIYEKFELYLRDKQSLFITGSIELDDIIPNAPSW